MLKYARFMLLSTVGLAAIAFAAFVSDHKAHARDPVTIGIIDPEDGAEVGCDLDIRVLSQSVFRVKVTSSCGIDNVKSDPTEATLDEDGVWHVTYHITFCGAGMYENCPVVITVVNENGDTASITVWPSQDCHCDKAAESKLKQTAEPPLAQ